MKAEHFGGDKGGIARSAPRERPSQPARTISHRLPSAPRGPTMSPACPN